MMKVLDLPYGRFRDKGQPIDNVSNYDSSQEECVYLVPLSSIMGRKVLFGTASAMVKKVAGKEFDVSKRTTAATKLAQGDKVIFVRALGWQMDNGETHPDTVQGAADTSAGTGTAAGASPGTGVTGNTSGTAAATGSAAADASPGTGAEGDTAPGTGASGAADTLSGTGASGAAGNTGSGTGASGAADILPGTGASGAAGNTGLGTAGSGTEPGTRSIAAEISRGAASTAGTNQAAVSAQPDAAQADMHVKDRSTVIMQSEKGMFLRIETESIPEKKKSAIGVRGMRLAENDQLTHIYLLGENDEMTEADYEQSKVVLNRLRIGTRDTKGVNRQRG